ncbi:response regulator receiver and unknown domain protein [Paludibacter propionicigenes WB4]|uniref:Response regulatory domain-containing protein n=1 Tax=Paludibacter propionicigenes (strain DSM 17365 / JCM 13257 / WB4) TaxID=694427 RepID=E4T821_PALPW|nr:response regulator [Paludibacter propionicigenes]ADQ80865.1 response regulator receiver and unknown domain protein [Paludibacter propionicigenes WB4]
MKIVIIEDEEFAARRLKNMINEYDSTIEVVAKLESVKESIDWFKNNEHPDLIFLDIHLEDDLSFAIFQEVPISCAIVFTTATDELATRAFQLKGIDFMLKPITQADLVNMIEKYRNKPTNEKPVDAHIFNEITNATHL